VAEEPGRAITVDGVALTLLVERKRVKNVNARLKGDTLRVSAPPNITSTRLDEVVVELARRLLRRAHGRRVNRETDAVALGRRVAKRFAAEPRVEHVEFSAAGEARWGSYSARTRTVRLHAALRHMPTWVLEAVVAHELAHTEHLDHSPAFWALARAVCPDTDRARAFLAGVSWLAHAWATLPPLERAILARNAAPVDEDAGLP
jgi:predicted metal-dependent hydrolase